MTRAVINLRKTIKDVLQSLVDDGLVDSDKIGSGKSTLMLLQSVDDNDLPLCRQFLLGGVYENSSILF